MRGGNNRSTARANAVNRRRRERYTREPVTPLRRYAETEDSDDDDPRASC